MTKEEKIDEAYGDYADIARELRDENGWIKHFDYCTYFPQHNEKKIIKDYLHKRPISLRGIENNNGWTKIETKEDLPEFGYYEVVVRSNGEMIRATLDENTPLVYYSHYQTISELNPPLH